MHCFIQNAFRDVSLLAVISALCWFDTFNTNPPQNEVSKTFAFCFFVVRLCAGGADAYKVTHTPCFCIVISNFAALFCALLCRRS
jgi:hypothetical protein